MSLVHGAKATPADYARAALSVTRTTDSLQRILRRLDQDVHRSPSLRDHLRRLTFNDIIIETGSHSYRLASTRARAEEPA